MDPNLILSFIIDGILIGSIYALVSTGLNLISGIMGIINFAQGDFLMLGMFMSYLFLTLFGIPLLCSVPLSFLAMFFVGCLLMRNIFTPLIKRGIGIEGFLLITYALSSIISISAQHAFGTEYKMVPAPFGRYAFQIGFISVTLESLTSLIMASVISIMLYMFLTKTKVGKAIRATSQDPEAASVLGINVGNIRTVNMGLGIALAAAGGSILTFTYFFSAFIGRSFTFKAITVCVLGGWGNHLGALLGAFILGIAESVSLLFVSANLKEVVAFVIFILILMLRPRGLFGKAA